MRLDVIAGRFALCDPIAGGSTGTVWRAWDLKQRRFCAAKVLRQRDSGDLIRFTREQAVRLAHRHVLTPYSWVAEDEHVLIASDLIGGGSASTLIGDWGPLSAPTVADLTAQLLDGLAHVHETGLTHRDVKPGNVLLDNSPQPDGTPFAVRLADFGLAVRSDDARLTQHGLVIGTPGYLSPEALAGDVPAPAQDLYAVGRLALSPLHGREPVEVNEPSDFTQLPPNSALSMVVRALLASDPAQRPGAVAARDALRSARTAPSSAGSVLVPMTAYHDPVVLADQLPPFPDGWSSSGPDPSLLEPAHQDRADIGSITSAVPVSPVGVSVKAFPAELASVKTPLVETPSANHPLVETPPVETPSFRTPFAGIASDQTPSVGATRSAGDVDALSSSVWSPPPPNTRGLRGRVPVPLIVAVSVIAWLAAMTYLIRDVITKAGDDTGSSSSTASAPSRPTPSATPSTVTSSRSSASAPTPTANATTSLPPALNGGCAFAQEGNEVIVGTTTLRCTRVGSRFVWKQA